MAALVEQAKADIFIRERALAIVSDLRGKDRGAEIATLFNWVRQNIRYVGDIRNIETVSTPQKTLDYRQGDCDDQVTLLAALLEAIGYETRFIAVGFIPATFTHVMLQVMYDGNWINLDPTEPNAIGWFPPGVQATMVQAIN